MEDLNNQVQDGTLTFAQFNQVMSEIQDAIESTGQTLAAGTLDQLTRAIVLLGGAANYFTASGTDTVVLTSVAAFGSGLESYEDGYEARFRPANANTGAVTVNIDGLGAVDLTDEGGGALAANALVTTQDAHIRYSAAAGDFFLLQFTEATLADEELLSTTVLSAQADSGNLALTAAGGFEEYRIELRAIIPATDNQTLEMEVADNATPTYLTGASDYGNAYLQQNEGSQSNTTGAAAHIVVGNNLGANAGDSWDADVFIRQPGDGTNPFSCTLEGSGQIATAVVGYGRGGGAVDPVASTTRIQFVRFLMSAGNLTSGTIRVWGIRR